MYQPPHFVETRLDVLHALIRAHPLGLLISVGPDGPVADPLPFLIDTAVEPHGRLRAHLAKANPQWRLIAENPQTPGAGRLPGRRQLRHPILVREPSARPARWCQPGIMRSSRCAARARIVDDREWLAAQIAELTATHEAHRAEPWQVTDAPAPFIEAQMKGIIGLEIAITEISGKWKVSQNRPVAAPRRRRRGSG